MHRGRERFLAMVGWMTALSGAGQAVHITPLPVPNAGKVGFQLLSTKPTGLTPKSKHTPNKNIPIQLIENYKKTCVIGLICDATRLSDVRRNRIQSMHEDRPTDYINEKKILNELENSKILFKKYNWPIIDVTRKSVEETAASIIKILDILNSQITYFSGDKVEKIESDYLFDSTYLDQHKAVLDNDFSKICSLDEGIKVMEMIDSVQKVRER